MPEQALRFHEAYSRRMIVSCGVGAAGWAAGWAAEGLYYCKQRTRIGGGSQWRREKSENAMLNDLGEPEFRLNQSISAAAAVVLVVILFFFSSLPLCVSLEVTDVVSSCHPQ